MKIEVIEKMLTRRLRVREPLALRELADSVGLLTNDCSRAIRNLVDAGVAVKHPGSTRRGDRAPRYTKASRAKS